MFAFSLWRAKNQLAKCPTKSALQKGVWYWHSKRCTIGYHKKSNIFGNRKNLIFLVFWKILYFWYSEKCYIFGILKNPIYLAFWKILYFWYSEKFNIFGIQKNVKLVIRKMSIGILKNISFGNQKNIFGNQKNLHW